MCVCVYCVPPITAEHTGITHGFLDCFANTPSQRSKGRSKWRLERCKAYAKGPGLLGIKTDDSEILPSLIIKRCESQKSGFIARDFKRAPRSKPHLWFDFCRLINITPQVFMQIYKSLWRKQIKREVCHMCTQHSIRHLPISIQKSCVACLVSEIVGQWCCTKPLQRQLLSMNACR